MFSLGIEYERAFSIAFARARLAAGSPPHSRAATINARASLEKSLPRFASAAPFLCLIELHLLCPDTHPLPHQLEELLVHALVVWQLRVERSDDDPALAQEHGLAVELGEYLHLRPGVDDARRADEDAAQRLPVELEVGLEARHLSPVGVALDLEVEHAEVVPVEQDHPGARAEDRPLELSDRLFETVEPHQAPDRGRFAARDHEAVQVLQLVRLAHLDRLRSEAA